MFASKLTVEPAREPLTLDEVKDHLYIDTEVVAEDAYVSALIKVARQYAENYTHRAFITQTWETRFNHFSEVMELPRPALQSVSSVIYVSDGSPTLETVASSVYDVDTHSERGRIWRAYNQTWPDPRVIRHAVRVTHVCGYGANGSDVPDVLRQAILLLVGAWYENREPVGVGAGVVAWAAKAPVSVEAMLLPYLVARP